MFKLIPTVFNFRTDSPLGPAKRAKRGGGGGSTAIEISSMVRFSVAFDPTISF
jgi:hypothetical protein